MRYLLIFIFIALIVLIEYVLIGRASPVLIAIVASIAIFIFELYRRSHEVVVFEPDEIFSSPATTGKIEPLDMRPIFDKYPMLPKNIAGHLVYPPIGYRDFKYPTPFENITFQDQVDKLPQDDLIVYVEPKNIQSLDECIDRWVEIYMATNSVEKTVVLYDKNNF